MQIKNKIASSATDTHAPWRFMYLRETKSWWCEGEEKVSVLTHATARGVGKNALSAQNPSHSQQYSDTNTPPTEILHGGKFGVYKFISIVGANSKHFLKKGDGLKKGDPFN